MSSETIVMYHPCFIWFWKCSRFHFNPFKHDCPPQCDLVLDAAHRKSLDLSIAPRKEDIVDSIIFKATDAVAVTFKDVDLNFAKKGKDIFFFVWEHLFSSCTKSSLDVSGSCIVEVFFCLVWQCLSEPKDFFAVAVDYVVKTNFTNRRQLECCCFTFSKCSPSLHINKDLDSCSAESICLGAVYRINQPFNANTVIAMLLKRIKWVTITK